MIDVAAVLHQRRGFRRRRWSGLDDEVDSKNIAPSKAWERRIPCERMKPFERIQLVKVQYADLFFDQIEVVE